MSKPITELAAIDTAGTTTMLSIAIVAVAAAVAELANTMFETTVIVDVLGTVYRVVLDVAAAVLASTWVNVAISYYLSFIEHP
jgi:trans-aconitate methyltransferase